MQYKLGQTYALEGTGILGDPMDKRYWFIFRTPPMKEFGACAWLERQGALEAWYPTEECWRPTPPGARRRKVPYLRRIAPGYVFALFDREPRWHVLFEAARGRISRVVDYEGRPIAFGHAVIARMQHVPKRLEVLHKQAERERFEAWLAKQPVAGHSAVVLTGALAGRRISVTEIHGGLAECLYEGMRLMIEATSLERKD